MGLPLSYRRVLDQTTKEGRVKTRIYESDEYNLPFRCRYRLHHRKGGCAGSGKPYPFSDYERHYANIQETLAKLLKKAVSQTGDILVIPVITGSGGLTLSSHLHIPFVQEVVAVASSLQDYAPQTDVAIELGGEDAKIIILPAESISA